MIAGYGKILEELRRGAAGKPELAETVSLYVDLFSAQSRADVDHIESATLAQEASMRLQRGLPILAPEEFRAEPAALAHLCDEICVITTKHRPDLSTALDAIRLWLDEQKNSILVLSAEYLRSEVRACEEGGLDGSLLAFVFNNALHPFLRKYAEALMPLVDESIWYRPRCPICGGAPDFAALAKGTGARRLLCSRCDAEWAFGRVACPFCECDVLDRQRYLLSDDRVYRLYTCERCGRYLKTIDLREVEGERLLPVERILTLQMDLAARQAEPRFRTGTHE